MDKIKVISPCSLTTASRRNRRKKHEPTWDHHVIDDKMSERILTQVLLQREELEAEYGFGIVSDWRKGPSLLEEDSQDTGEESAEEEELYIELQGSIEPTIVPSQMESKIDNRVEQVYKAVGQILAKYRSGKLPKAFQVIPLLSNWKEMLYLTEPDKWSAASMLQATRIFSSSLSAMKAQKFYNLVLLPRIRDDILEYKRLNFHLYMALKKSLFKPAAFFKGILLPLCQSGTCTLHEALIISSVIAKTSIPLLYSCAALLKIAEMEYSGANSIFLRTLLDKKYALPYRVIDAVVFHFLRTHSHDLPVLWYQSLLTFVRHYKEDISFDQKEVLLKLLCLKSHQEISEEVRKEIVHSKCRDIGAVYNDISKKQIVAE